MSASATPRFARLLDLARAESSDMRRELLREVTDLFFHSGSALSEREDRLFEEVMIGVARDLSDEGLVEVAERMATSARAPRTLIKNLAARSIRVSEPVLRQSPVLTDTDLIEIVENQSEEHVRAIAMREVVSTNVADAIVDRGDDITVNTLLGNEGATIGRQTMEKVVERARESILLHDNLILRRDLPIDLMNEMYFAVATRLRQVILERNAHADPAEVELALSKAHARISKIAIAENAEASAARRRIEELQSRKALTPAALISLYRERNFMAFAYGLAELTGVDYPTVQGILDRKDMDGLAMVCRAAGMERPLFVTIAILSCGGESAMGRAESFGKLYVQVPIEAAQRAVRFFKVRRGSDPTVMI